MKKRIFIRIISYLIAVILVFSVLIIKEYKYAKRLEGQVVSEYKDAYAELNEKIGNINVLLKKAVYSTSSQKIATLSAEIYSESELAKSALSKLSGDTESHKILNRFLSQAGDYSRYLADSLIFENNELTLAQQKNLRILSDFASLLSETVSETHIDSENLEYWVSELTKKVKEDNGDNFDDTLSDIESNIANYPNIIYDGPYSDYVEREESEMLKGLDAITDDYAQKIANNVIDGNLKSEGAFEEGAVEGYKFTEGNAFAKISKKGGLVLAFDKGRSVSDSVLSYEQALNKAERYLADNKYDNMRATYHRSENNICIVNFAFVDGQTLCYTDLIKIGVALDNGEIVSFDAFGYVINHKTRVFESLSTTEEQAREVLPASLSVKASAISLIPTETGGETRCYEFLCSGYDGEEILIFINVSTLETEEIFLILSDENGTVLK